MDFTLFTSLERILLLLLLSLYARAGVNEQLRRRGRAPISTSSDDRVNEKNQHKLVKLNQPISLRLKKCLFFLVSI